MRKLLSLRWYLAFVAVSAAGLGGVTGCGETTGTEIVRYKNQDSEARMVEAGEYEDIRSQVEAPRRYKAALHDQNNMMTVNVDAEIQIPDAEGIKIKKVEARPFTQEDYDAVHKAVMDNALTQTGGYFPGDGQQAVTREEFEMKVKELEKISDKLLSGDAQMLSQYSIDSVTEQLKYYYQLLNEQPDIFETVPVDIEVRYSEEAAKRRWYMTNYGVSSAEAEEALRKESVSDISDSRQPIEEKVEETAGAAAAAVDVDGAVDDGENEQYEADQSKETETYNEAEANFFMNENMYIFRLDNNLSEYNKNTLMCIDRYGSIFDEIWRLSDEDRNMMNQTLTLEEAEEMAGETIKKMGITDMELAHVNQGYTYVYNEGAQMVKGDSSSEGYENAFSFIYTRTLDGVPIGYDTVYGSSYEVQGNLPYTLYWPFECIILSYDKNGLLDFSWVGPYEISELSDEYVFLLPFSEIRNIFESIILKKNADYAEQGLATEMSVDKVTLSYMRIWEDSARGDATLIPVWNFYGTYNVVGETPDNARLIVDGSSLLTINAMDGTIVNIERGY